MTAKKRPRIASLVVALTFGASLVACSNEGSSSGPVNVTYSARLTGVGDDADAAVVAAFNKKFEGTYHVNRTAADDETYKTKQITQLTGAAAPDVFYSWAGGRAKDIIDSGFAGSSQSRV